MTTAAASKDPSSKTLSTRPAGAPPPSPPTSPSSEATTASIDEAAAVAAEVVDAFSPGREPLGEDMVRSLVDQAMEALDGWMDTEGTRAKVRADFERLSPAQYRAAVSVLDKEGLLDDLIGRGAARGAFLEQAARKGLVQKSPPVRADGASGAPDAPALFHRSPSFPRALRRAIHDENMARGQDYCARYNRYLDAYVEKVEDAPSAAHLRRLGPPGDFLLPKVEPGTSERRAEIDENFAWVVQVRRGRTDRAHAALSDRGFHLQGIRAPGDAWVFGRFTRSGAHASVQTGVSLETGRGVVFEPVKLGAKLGSERRGDRFPVEGGGTASTDGETELGGKVAGFGGSVVLDEELRVKGGSAEALGFVAEIEEGRKLSFGREVGVEMGEDLALEGRGRISIDGEAAEIEQSFGLSIQRGKVSTGAEIGAGIKLMPSDVAELIGEKLTRRLGFFDVPPELASTSWRALDPVDRAFYQEGFGWTESEWESRRALVVKRVLPLR